MLSCLCALFLKGSNAAPTLDKPSLQCAFWHEPTYFGFYLQTSQIDWNHALNGCYPVTPRQLCAFFRDPDSQQSGTSHIVCKVAELLSQIHPMPAFVVLKDAHMAT